MGTDRDGDRLAGRLAQHVQGGRAAFEAAFRLAQQRAGKPRPVDFKAVGTSLDDRQAIAQGFAYAIRSDWLNPLVAACIEQALTTSSLLDELVTPPTRKRERVQPPTSELQSILDISAGFARADVELPGLFRLYRQTCRLLSSGQPIGSGVLVGPNVVLTAWHVVRPEIDPQSGTPTAGSDQRLTVEFEEIQVTSQAPAGENLVCNVTPDWLMGMSPCHPDELTGRLPRADKLQNLNDYALIQLAAVPGTDRGFLDLSRTIDAKPRSPVQVFQHPRGMKLRRSYGRLTKLHGVNRFLHRANTLDGSSGGPCVDSEFRFVGLHQAGLPPGVKVTRSSANRGVPVTAFLTEIKLHLAPKPSQMLWQLDNPPTPVIGRDDFQTAVLSATFAAAGATPAPQLITVSGTPHAEQVVCQRLLEALLPAASDRLISIPAGSLPDRPEELIRGILAAAGEANPAGVTLPAESDSGTTQAAWMRNQLVPAFAAALAKYTVQQRIWLAVMDLDLHAIPPGVVREFFAEVGEQIRSMPGLRVALFGFDGGIPPKALPVYRPIRLVDSTEAQIAVYFQRRFPTGLSSEDYQSTARWVWEEATRRQQAGREPELGLTEAIRSVINDMNLGQFGAGG